MRGAGLESRFWRMVRKGSGCWEWTGGLFKTGYGKFRGDSGKTMYAHRVSYSISKGDIPRGLMVMHSCDNRKCVRPSHLRSGTASDNVQDMITKNRHRPNPRYGKDHGMCRYSFRQVSAARGMIASGLSLAEVARMTGASIQSVHSWHHKRTRKIA